MERPSVHAQLGAGGFGSVYRGTFRHEEVAVKEVLMNEHGIRCPIEILIMNSVLHANLVKAISMGSWYCDEEKRHATYMVLDLSRGDLLRVKTTPRTIRETLFAMIGGILHLHNNGIIHCDIKPSNFLYYGEGDIRLTDFSLCCLASCNYSTVIGTRSFCAPEVFAGAKSSYERDIWSLGISVYNMLTRKSMFEKDTCREVLESRLTTKTHVEGRLGELEGQIDSELLYLLKRMLAWSPHKRPTAKALYFDSYFADLPKILSRRRIQLPQPLKGKSQIVSVLSEMGVKTEHLKKVGSLGHLLQKRWGRKVSPRACAVVAIKLYFVHVPKHISSKIVGYTDSDAFKKTEISLVDGMKFSL